jgi:hypothetical protein
MAEARADDPKAPVCRPDGDRWPVEPGGFTVECLEEKATCDKLSGSSLQPSANCTPLATCASSTHIVPAGTTPVTNWLKIMKRHRGFDA